MILASAAACSEVKSVVALVGNCVRFVFAGC